MYSKNQTGKSSKPNLTTWINYGILQLLYFANVNSENKAIYKFFGLYERERDGVIWESKIIIFTH